MLRIKLSYVGWFILLLVIYMAIVSPPTLGKVAHLIDHLFITIANGLTHFLDNAIK